MALNQFIPILWSTRLMANLYPRLVYAQPGVVNRDWEGEIRTLGDTVRILALGEVEVGEYTRNTDFPTGPQTLESAAQTLQITEAPYWNVFVDRLDIAQTNLEFMDRAMERAAFAVRKRVDGFIANMYTRIGNSATGNGNGSNIVGSDASPITVGLGSGEANAYELLVDVATTMEENNIPEENRYVVIPPWLYGLLKKDTRFTGFNTMEARETIRTGQVGDIDGLAILRSNLVPTTNNDQNYKIIAGHPMAITMAEQVTEIEAYKPERRFGDAVKGLLVFGAEVVYPQAVVLYTIKKGVV